VGRGDPREGTVGAHVYGFNTGSTGVSLMGTYMSEAPPAAAVAALQRLLAWKLELHGVDPAGTASLTCGGSDKYTQGQKVSFPTIAGHRDANYTACPGDALYARLSDVRAALASAETPPSISSLSLNTRHLSPNGDGVQDRLRVRCSIAEKVSWNVKILKDGKTVWLRMGEGEAVDVSWTGKDGSGLPVPDGSYAVAVTAVSASGTRATRSLTFTVDTVAPAPVGWRLERATFSPNGDGWKDDCRLTYSPSEPCSVRAGIVDSSGALQRSLSGWTVVTTDSQQIRWEGTVERSGKLVTAPNGRYRLRLEMRDLAGNVRQKSYSLTVDRTLGFAAPKPAAFSPNDDGVQETIGLGFRLTRQASVSVTISRNDVIVHTRQLGTLPAGAHSLDWNGKAATGAKAPNGRYRFTISARSSLASTNVGGAFTLDRYRPRLVVPAAVSTTLGQAAVVPVMIDDPHSPDVELWYVIHDAKASRVAAGSLGWVPVAGSSSLSWTAPKGGVYTITFMARDRAGNREDAAAAATLTVL
jgi:flagellar hook assembly protein FlgD